MSDKIDNLEKLKRLEFEKLKGDGSNWEVWRMRMETFLEHYELLEYAEGTKPRPRTTSSTTKNADGTPSTTITNADEIRKWEKSNREAFLYIINSVSEQVASMFTANRTAFGAWGVLIKKYTGRGLQAVAHLMKKLWRSTMTLDRDLGLQMQEYRDTALKLKGLGYEISEDLQTIAIILSLPPEYVTLKTILLTTDTPPGLQDTIDTIQSHETQLRQESENALLSRSSHHKRMKSKSQPNLTDKARCSNCQKSGHSIEQCWSVGGGAEGTGPKRERGKPKGKQEPKRESRAHVARDSRSSSPVVYVARTDEDAFVATSSQDRSSVANFIVDSGASMHMCNDQSFFSTYRKLNPPRRIWIADNRAIEAIGIGDIEVRTHLGDQTQAGMFRDVLYLPDLSECLLSTTKMSDAGVHTTFTSSSANLIHAPSNTLLTQAFRDRNLYKLKVDIIRPEQANFATVKEANPDDHALVARALPTSKATLELWHRRLGHISEDTIRKMVKTDAVKGMTILGSGKEDCSACRKGKQTRRDIPHATHERATEVLGRVYSDLCGPMETATPEGFRYFITFTDDHSRYTRIGFCKSKDEALAAFKIWKARAEKETGQQLKIFRTDGGGEYSSQEFKSYLAEHGIKREITNAFTPQENGVSERANRTINNLARSMIADANEVLQAKQLPLSFWALAVRHAVWIKNRIITSALSADLTPYQAYFGRKPNLVALRLFGCKAYAHIPDKQQSGKFSERAIEGVHVGFAEDKKAYMVYNRDKRRLLESRDIEFEEGGEKERVVVELEMENDDDGGDGEVPKEQEGDQYGVSEGEKEAGPGKSANDANRGAPGTAASENHQSPIPPKPNTPNRPSDRHERVAPSKLPPDPTKPRRSTRQTKGKAPLRADEDPKMELGSRKPKRLPEASVDSLPVGAMEAPDGGRSGEAEKGGDEGGSDDETAFTATDSPRTFKEAMDRGDAEEWMAAISEEYNNLKRKGVFVEVEAPGDARVHEGRLVFGEKTDSEGNVTRKKVRIVAKGYTEVYGEDYFHTYSPTLGRDTLFSCLAYAASEDLEIHQLDAVAAYLNSDLSEELYLRPPTGILSDPGKVWQLKKALYGLKQAGLEWYRTLREHIKSLGYKQSGYDPCLYIRDKEHYILVYVDDLLVFSRMDTLVTVKEEIAGRYEMRDMGEAHWFLAMEITRDRTARTITINQRKYINKILNRFGLENCRPMSTPMAASLKLPKQETPTIDQHLYQSMLGSLMYAAVGTRPDIAFAVHFLAQHTLAPGKKHLEAIKRVFHYLKGTQNLGLIYDGKRVNEDLMGFTDSDWAGDPNSRRSVSGYCFIFCGAVVSWSSKKQPTIALSSTEAEYMALTHAGKEAVFLQNLYGDIGIQITAPLFLLVDNQSAIALAENPIFHARSKHIEVRQHWIREKIEDGRIRLEYTPTSDQVADIFTKPLNAEKFVKFRDALGLVLVNAQ